MTTYINSNENKTYKLLKKLSKRTHREEHRLFIAEGARIAREAAESGLAEFLVSATPIETDVPLYIVSDSMFMSVSDTKSPQGVLAVCRMPEYDNVLSKSNFVLICDRISDPGNLGTIIRTAEAAGVDLVMLTKGTVDPYNSKTVRSTMGSVFRVPVICECESVEVLKNNGFKIAATTLTNAVDLYSAELTGKIALVMGSEAHGVGREFIDGSDIRVKIPMYGNVESLNAAIAASIAMYEVKRQRG